jgi:predicted phosphoribosyltransferase
MIYEDRWDAALRLIPMLSRFAEEDCVVLAVPRGGVPIGYAISKAYSFPLDLLLAKKLGHPGNPELAIGAVCLDSETVDAHTHVSEDYIREEIPRIRKTLLERRRTFMGDRSPVDLADRTVIIADDGIATGHTLMAAIGMIRKRKPRRIIVAVPVAPRETARTFRELADEFICPYLPDDFYAVGQFYRQFDEVTDDEVIRLMQAARDLENARSDA